MDEIPAWALEKAREAVAKQRKHEGIAQVVARAIVAERERAAKIAENVELFNDRDCLKNSDPRATVAAAIRKGE